MIDGVVSAGRILPQKTRIRTFLPREEARQVAILLDNHTKRKGKKIM